MNKPTTVFAVECGDKFREKFEGVATGGTVGTRKGARESTKIRKRSRAVKGKVAVDQPGYTDFHVKFPTALLGASAHERPNQEVIKFKTKS